MSQSVQYKILKWTYTYPEICEKFRTCRDAVHWIFLSEPIALDDTSALLRNYRKYFPHNLHNDETVLRTGRKLIEIQRHRPEHAREYYPSDEGRRSNGTVSAHISRLMRETHEHF